MRILLIVGMLLVVCGCGEKPEADAPQETTPQEPALAGQPTWFPLGGEVYFARDLPQAQAKLLSFRKQPRWFVGGKDAPLLSYPKTLADVPLADRGASLRLAVEKGKAAGVLCFDVTLSAAKRPVFREVQHRWNNLVPLLFAFYLDGKAVVVPPTSFGMEGGVNQWHVLAKRGGEKHWSLRVSAESIRALLPKGAQTVDVVCAFAERQHMGYFAGEDAAKPLVSKNESSDVDENDAIRHPIVIRSNVVRLPLAGVTGEGHVEGR